MKGIVIENSLKDKSILKEIEITRSWQDGTWKLHEVRITEDKVKDFSKVLESGWYTHFWEPGKDKVWAVFKDKIFTFNHSDKNTWEPAVDYGKSIGIIAEQLDFPID